MSEFQVCCCGAQPGYPHESDCPRPCYNASDAQYEQWEQDRLASIQRVSGEMPGTGCQRLTIRDEQVINPEDLKEIESNE